MHLPPHGVRAYADPTASGGRAVVFTHHVAVTIGPARFGATRVGVWARANHSRGNALAAVRIDHRLVLRAAVHPGKWREVSAPVRLRSGQHLLQVSFQNPRRTSACQRRLLLNKVVVSDEPGGSRRQWHLVFDDEFNGAQLDTAKWNPFQWNAQSGFYDPSNALVEGGLLRLRASSPTSSAMVQTLGKFALLYGRIEASIRMPRGQGFWPAFWLMPTAVATVDGPEIDVLEMWMTDRTDDLNDSHTVSQNYHWDSSGQHRQEQSWVRGPTDYAAGFHRFGLVWDSHSLRWYIDGVETKELTGPIVSQTPMFIIFSLQIGHAWWLGPDGEPNTNTSFPSYMDVDWVRAYRR
jgi:beta-glucanase (GH16 family)